MKRLTLLLLIVVALVLALGSAAIARAGSSANYTTLREPNELVAGAQTAASANYTISSTAGQLATGQGASANYSVCSGLWCQAQAALAQLFLPLVRR